MIMSIDIIIVGFDIVVGCVADIVVNHDVVAFVVDVLIIV